MTNTSNWNDDDKILAKALNGGSGRTLRKLNSDEAFDVFDEHFGAAYVRAPADIRSDALTPFRIACNACALVEVPPTYEAFVEAAAKHVAGVTRLVDPSWSPPEWSREQFDEELAKVRAAHVEADAVEAVQAEREREIEERRAREAAKIARERWVSYGLPVKEIGRALSGDSMRDTDALSAVREMLRDGTKTILVLSGPRGVGKTTAAAWWLVQERPSPLYFQPIHPGFVDAIKLARWPKYDKDSMRDLEDAHALAIDDLGVEYDDRKGAFRSFFDGLINARYSKGLATVITTNLPAAAFVARYGERVADRLREAGTFVELKGGSLRTNKSEGETNQ